MNGKEQKNVGFNEATLYFFFQTQRFLYTLLWFG